MALLAVGTSAPTFKGQNLVGPEINLESLKGKKPVALIFGPDQVNPAQTNQTKTVYNKYRVNVEMIVTVRQVPSVAMAKAFLQQFGVNFPVLYDPKQEVYKSYGVEKPVVVYVIDKEGIIAYAAQVDPKQLDVAALETALNTVMEK